MKHRNAILGGRKSVKVAIPQFPPVWMDLQKSVERACGLIREAGREGAELVAFSESWLPGYPYWTEGWDSDLEKWSAARLIWYENSISIPSEELDALVDAARSANTYVVMACNERDGRPGTATVYNTLLFIGREGKLIGKHRKLVPVGLERLFYGRGDSRDVAVFETDIGRVGGLICSENTMTAVRAALIAMGEDIHVAPWGGNFSFHTGPRIHEADRDGLFYGHAVSRCHAVEAAAFVVEPVAIMDEAHVPPDFPMRERMNFSYSQGDSSVIGPLGVPIAGPVEGQKMIYATLESDHLKLKRAVVDTVGHYGRPDVVQVLVKPYSGEMLQEGSHGRPSGRTMPDSDSIRTTADRYDLDEDILREAIEDLLSSSGRSLGSG